MPSIVPYSSITIAMCCFVRLNSASSARRSFVSGTIVAGRRSSSRSTAAMPRSCIAATGRARGGRRRCRRASRGRPGSACTASRAPPAAPPRAAARSRARRTSGRGDHHVGDLLVGEVEDLVDHLLLAALDLALLRRAREQHPQLGLRVGLVLGARRLLAERAQHELGRALQQPDQRPKHEEEAAHRRRDGERRPLGMAERDPLRHELADHDVEEGDDQQREDRRRANVAMHRLEEVREHRLAEGADRQRGERDAELHRRDELRRVAVILQHGARAAVALALELADARAPRRDEAVLGRHEERVQQDQAREGEQLEGEGHPRCAATGAQVLGGKSSSKRPAS